MQPHPLPEKPTGSFFLSLQTALVEFFIFLKETGCLPLLLGSPMTTISLNQCHSRYGANTQITLSSDLFSHGKVQCVLGMSLHSSETAGKHDFVNLGIGA